MLVSIVIPCYNSEKSIEEVVELTRAEFAKLPDYRCEFVLVNDASADGTFEKIRLLAERFPEMDEKILCLGEADITLPKKRVGWGSTMKRLRSEIGLLIGDLCAENEETR